MYASALYTFSCVCIYSNCSRAINHFLIIKYAYYLKICLMSPWCAQTLNKRKKKNYAWFSYSWTHIREIILGWVYYCTASRGKEQVICPRVVYVFGGA